MGKEDKTTVVQKGIRNKRALRRLLNTMFKENVFLGDGPGYVVFLDRLQKIHIIGYVTADQEKELIKRYSSPFCKEKDFRG